MTESRSLTQLGNNKQVSRKKTLFVKRKELKSYEKENVETCDFCGAEVSDELLGVSPENDNVLICEECVEKARKMLQDAKGDNVGVSVFGIKYDGNSKASTIDVTLDLTLWCSPTFDNMKLVEKLGRNINDMKL